MGIRTEQQYWDSIRKQKTEVYIMGERVEEVIDHPLIKGSASGAALTFRYAHDPQYRDLFTIQSPLVNEPVNRYVSVHNNIQDLMEKVKLIRFVAQKTGECAQRCMGWDALNALYSVTYETDHKYETPYHSRFKDYLTWVQKKDIMVHGTMTDPRETGA